MCLLTTTTLYFSFEDLHVLVVVEFDTMCSFMLIIFRNWKPYYYYYYFFFAKKMDL